MDVRTLQADLRAKSKLIHHLKSRRDRGEFKSVNDALALQRAEREAQRLRDQLPPLSLVTRQDPSAL